AELVAVHGPRWRALCDRADRTAERLGGAEVTLDHVTRWREPARAGAAVAGRDATDGDARLVEFRGESFTRTEAPISGGLVTAYDPSTPQIWRVPMRDKVKPLLTVRAPRGGYVVPVAFASDIAPRLAAHGITFTSVARRLADSTVEAFHAQRVQFS